MPTRLIRDGILTSEAVAALSWPAEVLYRRLMSVADDHGRFHALPKLIRAACYPLQIDKVSDADIGKWLTECVTAALVSVYPASDGKRYLQIEKFGQQVRSKSKFPAATESDCEQPETGASNCLQEQADVHLGVCVVEDEDVGVKTRKRAPTKSRIPDGFGISDRVKAWASEKGHAQLDQHLEHFRMTCAAKGYTYADWDSAFMRAIADNWAKVSAVVTTLPAGGRRKLA